MLSFNTNELLVLSYLRENARMKLTVLSKKTGIPISTIFDQLQRPSPITKGYTALLNFTELGFMTRAQIILKVQKDCREELGSFLLKHKSVNSAYRINNGFDYMVEGIFRDLKELEEFLETLDESYTLKMKQVFYIIEDLKREAFLSNPSYLPMVTQAQTAERKV